GANTFKLGIMWVYVLYWAEDPLTEQTIAFWFLGTVVDSFWLGNLAIRPFGNIIGAGYSQSYCVKVSNICSTRISAHHLHFLLFYFIYTHCGGIVIVSCCIIVISSSNAASHLVFYINDGKLVLSTFLGDINIRNLGSRYCYFGLVLGFVLNV